MSEAFMARKRRAPDQAKTQRKQQKQKPSLMKTIFQAKKEQILTDSAAGS